MTGSWVPCASFGEPCGSSAAGRSGTGAVVAASADGQTAELQAQQAAAAEQLRAAEQQEAAAAELQAQQAAAALAVSRPFGHRWQSLQTKP